MLIKELSRRLDRKRAVMVAIALTAAAPGTTAAGPLVWPSADERVRGWQADLDSTLTAFLGRDRSFDPDARENFVYEIRSLRGSVATLTDEQVIVRLATAVASAHNAHTRLYLLRNRTVLRRYPIRVWWFGDELGIVRVHPENADVLGGRIVKIAGRPATEVAQKVAPLYAANKSWSRYMSSYLLTSPEILKGVGVLEGDDLDLTVETRDNKHRTVRLAPMPLERSDQPFEAWWDLGPNHPGRQGPWVSPFAVDTTSVPLYLRQPTRNYWTSRIADKRLVYLQYNRAQDEPEGEPVGAFGQRFLHDLQRDPPQKLVVDLRFNTGGNLDLADSLFRGIAALPMARERGRLFVITGRATFSAGITAAATLRQLTRAIFVGEPVGDALDMWSEGGNILLPNTKLTLHYANGFHSYSPREYPDRRPYNYPDLSVKDVGPDILAECTLAQYLAGRDAAMEAVVKFKH